MLIGFAADPGTVALEPRAAGSRNGFYTQALLHHIERYGHRLDVRLLLGHVAEHVWASTSGEQRPWVNTSLVGGEFTILPRPAGVCGSDRTFKRVDVLDVMQSLGVEDDTQKAVAVALGAVGGTPFVTLEQLKVALTSAGIDRRLALRIEDGLVSSVCILQAMNSLRRAWWVSVLQIRGVCRDPAAPRKCELRDILLSSSEFRPLPWWLCGCVYVAVCSSMETSCPVLSFSHTPPLLRRYPSPRSEVEVGAALVRQMYHIQPMEQLMRPLMKTMHLPLLDRACRWQLMYPT
jgi:hypothetical protein